MKKYLVISLWVNRVLDTEYNVFIDGDTGEENFYNAKSFYDKQVVKDGISSCNLCEIIESTDY